jgi:hypothetical protein
MHKFINGWQTAMEQINLRGDFQPISDVLTRSPDEKEGWIRRRKGWICLEILFHTKIDSEKPLTCFLIVLLSDDYSVQDFRFVSKIHSLKGEK